MLVETFAFKACQVLARPDGLRLFYWDEFKHSTTYVKSPLKYLNYPQVLLYMKVINMCIEILTKYFMRKNKPN